MNAIQSAHTLDWRGSSAFDPALSIGPVDPAKVYGFMSRSTFDPAFRQRLSEDAASVFEEYGFEGIGRASVLDDLDAKLSLEIHERAALDDLTRAVRNQGLDAVIESEKATLQQGYGMPAIAILVVVVAVALWVVVVSTSDQQY